MRCPDCGAEFEQAGGYWVCDAGFRVGKPLNKHPVLGYYRLHRGPNEVDLPCWQRWDLGWVNIAE